MVLYLMLLAIVAVPVGGLATAIYRTARRQPSLEWWTAVVVWLATILVWYSGAPFWLAVAIGIALMLGGLLAISRRSAQ